MKKTGIRPPLLWGGLIIVLFAVSLLFNIFMNDGTARRVLFFRDELSQEIRGEERRLPKRDSTEENIKLLIREVILGPENYHYSQVVPDSTSIRSMLYRDNTVYLDFNMDILFPKNSFEMPFDEMIEAVKKTVYYNYPLLKNVYVTVNGQVPHSPYFKIKEQKLHEQ